MSLNPRFHAGRMHVMSRGKFLLLASFIAWSALTGNENVRACTGGMLRQVGNFLEMWIKE
jgi:hypothetical protein